MHRSMLRFAPAALTPLLVAGLACSAPWQSPTTSPTTSATNASPTVNPSVAAQLSGQACQVLTSEDVRATLGVPVKELPVTSLGGGGAGDAMYSGCNYAPTAGTGEGAALFLLRDFSIDAYASLPGMTKVAGIADQALLQAPTRIFARKGHITIQITLVSETDDPKAAEKLKTLARIAASRL